MSNSVTAMNFKLHDIIKKSTILAKQKEINIRVGRFSI